jgi:hypothetical protein
MKRTRLKKPMALLLALIMVMSLLPVSTLAVTDNNSKPTVVTGQETQTGSATPSSCDGSAAAVPYTGTVSSWFTDADSDDTLTYSVVSAVDSANNTVSSGDYAISEGVLTYTPAAAQAGTTVTITVKANDGTAYSADNVVITVNVGSVTWNFADGESPYLYLQYDSTYFDFILIKNGTTLYDSTDGIDDNESEIINAESPIEIGTYDYTIQLKDDSACAHQGSFEIKKEAWKDYWEYQFSEGWGEQYVAIVNIPTFVLKNQTTVPANLILKDENDEILTPNYQEMEDNNEGVKRCVYFGDLFNEGEHFEDGEVNYPEDRQITWEATPLNSDYEAQSGAKTWGTCGDSAGPTFFQIVLYNESASFQAPKGQGSGCSSLARRITPNTKPLRHMKSIPPMQTTMSTSSTPSASER